MERGPVEGGIVTVRRGRAMRAKASPQASTPSIFLLPRPQDSMRRARSATILGCFLGEKNSGDAGSRDFSHAMADDG